MKYLIITLALLVAPVLVSGQESASEKEYLNLGKNDLAIKGYDPVSYFMESGPKEGSGEFSFKYKEATYHFVNQTNLDTFKADPEKYVPAYGGWCAYAMGKGYTADINPETYKILDGKLLLFYNKFFTNTLPKWNKDEKDLYPAAEKNWEEKSFDQ